MRTVKIIFAAFFLTVMLNACAPNEDVNPKVSPEDLEKFEVKSSDSNGQGKLPGAPPNP